jgi:hypothetical protein
MNALVHPGRPGRWRSRERDRSRPEHGAGCLAAALLVLFGGCAGGPPADTGDSAAADTAPPDPGVPSLSGAGASFLGAPSSAAGSAVAGPGDLDGDGHDDIVVTAFYGSIACVWYGPVAPGVTTLAEADACLVGEGAYDFAGYTAAGAGDVDGDGHPDLLVSAGGNDEGGADAGKVYLFTTPPPAGTSSFEIAAVSFLGEASGDGAGSSLAAAGDVDGDGTADLLVGAAGNDLGGAGAGRVYLIRGPLAPGTTSLADAPATFTGTSTTAAALAHGASTGGDALGDAVAGVGDVDGDGLDDLLLGASGADGNGTDAGVAWLVYGPVADGDHGAADADTLFIGAAAGSFTGGAVAGPGDLDGDGHADLAIAADGTDGGAVYVVLGPVPASAAPLAETLPRLVGDDDELVGWSVAGVGDVDGDGHPDLAIGAPGSDVGAPDGGGIHIVFDAATPGVRALADVGRFVAGEGASDAAGRALAGAGDPDGDGLADVLTGAIYNQDGGVFAGKGYLVYGAAFTDR